MGCQYDINTWYFWLLCTSSIFKLWVWDGPLLLPLLFPHRRRLSEAFSQGGYLPLRAVLHLLSCSNILNAPLSTRVWFHVLDCKSTHVFCQYASVGLE